MASIDLQPLTAVTSTIDTAIQNNNNESCLVASSLCVLRKTDEVNRLVIHNPSFGACSEESFIKVKEVSGNEVIEVKREHVKVSRSKCFIWILRFSTVFRK